MNQFNTISLEKSLEQLQNKIKAARELSTVPERHRQNIASKTFNTALVKLELWKEDIGVTDGTLESIEHESSWRRILQSKISAIQVLCITLVRKALEDDFRDVLSNLKDTSISIRDHRTEDQQSLPRGSDVTVDIERQNVPVDDSSSDEVKDRRNRRRRQYKERPKVLNDFSFLSRTFQDAVDDLVSNVHPLISIHAINTRKGPYSQLLAEVERIKEEYLAHSNVRDSTAGNLHEPPPVNTKQVAANLFPTASNFTTVDQQSALAPIAKPGDLKIQVTGVNDAPVSLLRSELNIRTRELRRVKEILRDFPWCLISGTTGMGKTSLSIRYANEEYENHTDGLNVFWISAASVEKFQRGFEHILGLLHDDALKNRSQKARMQAVRRCLESFHDGYNSSWLLVVDDVRPDMIPLLDKYLPGQTRSGKMIFTTSSARVSKHYDLEGNVVHLDALPNQEATKLLLSFAGSLDRDRSSKELKTAAEVAEVVGGLPLAIEQAGTLARQSSGGRFSRVLESYTTALSDQASQESDISATFLPLLAWLTRTYPSAGWLLRVLAFCDPDHIPFDVLIQGLTVTDKEKGLEEGISASGVTTLPRMQRLGSGNVLGRLRRKSSASRPSKLNFPSPLRDRDDRQLAINTLLECNLVGSRAEGVLHVHGTVRDLVLNVIGKEGTAKEYFEIAVDLLASTMESIQNGLDKPTTWQVCAILTPHFLSLVQCSDRFNVRSPRLVRTYLRLGWYFFASGQYSEAYACCSWTVPFLEPTEVVKVQEWRARILMKEDSFAEAEILLQSLLPRGGVQELDIGKHLQLAECLASVYYLSAQLQKAKDLYKRILQVLNGLDPKENIYRMRVYEGLANTYQRLGRPEDANELYQKCVAYRKKELGSRYMSLVSTTYNQARLYRDQGRYSEAEALFKRVVEDYKDTVGERHPDALLAAARLAYTYVRQGKVEEAKTLALATLDKQQKQFKGPKASVHYTLWVLGDVHAQLKQYAQATDFFQRALDGYEDDLGSSHLFTLSVRRDFSDMLFAQGQIEPAIAVLKAAESHIKGSAAASKLARLYDHQGWYLEGEKIARETLDIQRIEYGSKHPETNYTLWVLARIYAHQERHSEAKAHYQWAIEGYRRISGAVFGNKAELYQEFVQYMRSFGGIDPRDTLYETSTDMKALEIPGSSYQVLTGMKETKMPKSVNQSSTHKLPDAQTPPQRQWTIQQNQVATVGPDFSDPMIAFDEGFMYSSSPASDDGSPIHNFLASWRTVTIRPAGASKVVNKAKDEFPSKDVLPPEDLFPPDGVPFTEYPFLSKGVLPTKDETTRSNSFDDNAMGSAAAGGSL